MAEADSEVFWDAWAEHRGHLLNVAYRLVGSVSDAEDLVQEAYARLLREEARAIRDPRGWLVVVLTRLCLDHLRSARVRHESSTTPWFPEPLVNIAGASADPADIVTMDESVRMALLIVLEQLSPAERVVFVLHDVFEYSFEEVAPMVGRSAAACRQLASRARRRIEADASQARSVDPDEMRRVAERFIAACSGGEIQSLLEVLDPAVVGWADIGGALATLHQPSSGRQQVAARAMSFFGPASGLRLSLATVNGEHGIVAARDGRPYAVMVLMVREGLVTAIYAVADERKLARVQLRG